MVGEEKRHQMMQNLFGDQSEEEEEEVESEHESNRHPDFASDEEAGGAEPGGGGEVEGHGEADIESENEPQDLPRIHGDSDDEISQGSQDVEVDDQREESEAKYTESDEKEEYDQHVVTSKRHDANDSGSEQSGNNQYATNEDDEVNQARSPSGSPGEEKDEVQFLHSAPEIRDVFGESDDEELAEDKVQSRVEEDEIGSPMDEVEHYEEDEIRPEDMLPDEDAQYDSEEDHIEAKHKERPVGPPLELEIPFRDPPAESSKMHLIKVSNIMGIDPKPFDPRTYVEEDTYVTDESGSKKRIRLENNVVRWREVIKPDGSKSIESNARFVEWSDGSMQLLIGNEVLDISKQDAQHEHTHLFLRHGKGILQSQGQISSKMRFMPSSLSSNSHRMLTALVDSRNKKVYKVKNCVTEIDPEREKEQKEKAVSQSIRASAHLGRKKEKVNRKYSQPIRKERELSPGFLEDTPEEDDEYDHYGSRRPNARRRFEEDMEVEARNERRILNAKKGHKDMPRKPAFSASKSSKRPVEFSESEESQYETEGEEEGSPSNRRDDEFEQDDLGEEEEYVESEEEDEEPRHKVRESGGSHKRKEIEAEEDSPPRKVTNHRRMKMVYESDDDE